MQANVFLSGGIDSRVYEYLNGLGFVYQSEETYDRRIPMIYSTDERLLPDMIKRNCIVIHFDDEKKYGDHTIVDSKSATNDKLFLTMAIILEKSFPLSNIPERDQHYHLYGEIMTTPPARFTEVHVLR